jgi:hypothetical protein
MSIWQYLLQSAQWQTRFASDQDNEIGPLFERFDVDAQDNLPGMPRTVEIVSLIYQLLQNVWQSN